MLKRNVLLILFVALFWCAPVARPQDAAPVGAPNRIDVIDLSTEVDLGMVSYVERAVHQAELDHAALVVHINTFGGRLDAATKIRDLILQAKIPVSVAFIDKRAISAGALIALSCKKIVMSNGSTFGAATPIYETGEKASEKVNSYMRSEMRSTAETNHRNGFVAQAMVDESLGLDSLNGFSLPKGKLLTLTTDEAVQVGYADYRAESLNELKQSLGWSKATISSIDEGVSDGFIRLLTSGIVSSLLIILGIAGLFYSIKTGHFGAITIAGVAALILFFAGQYLTSVAPVIAIVVFVVGLGLMLIEISPVPSFGLAGVLGIVGIWLGLFLALAGDFRTLTPDRMSATIITLAVSLAGVFILAALILRYAPKATWLKKFRNEESSGDTSVFITNRAKLVGKTGITQTVLRPSGTAIIDDQKIDVVTSGAFLPSGVPIIVSSVTGNKILVRQLEVLEPSDSELQNGIQPDARELFGGRLPDNLAPRV